MKTKDVEFSRIKSLNLVLLLLIVSTCRTSTVLDLMTENSCLTNVISDRSFLSNLVSPLSSPSLNCTFFAPSNQAYNTLSLLNSTGLFPDKSTVLLYQTSPSFSLLYTPYVDTLFPTLVGGDYLRFNNYSLATNYQLNRVVTVNGIVLKSTLHATNGYLVVLDRFLYPPHGLLVSFLLRLPQFSIISEMVSMASASLILTLNSEYTTFLAPCDKAMIAFNNSLAPLGMSLSSLSQLQVDCFLLSHIIGLPFTLFTAAIPPNCILYNKLASTLCFSLANNSFSIVSGGGGSAQIIFPDLVVSNGVLHAINGVLPPSSLFQISLQNKFCNTSHDCSPPYTCLSNGGSSACSLYYNSSSSNRTTTISYLPNFASGSFFFNANQISFFQQQNLTFSSTLVLNISCLPPPNNAIVNFKKVSTLNGNLFLILNFPPFPNITQTSQKICIQVVNCSASCISSFASMVAVFQQTQGLQSCQKIHQSWETFSNSILLNLTLDSSGCATSFAVGAIVGIVIGCVVAIAGVTIFIIFYTKKKNKRSQEKKRNQVENEIKKTFD